MLPNYKMLLQIHQLFLSKYTLMERMCFSFTFTPGSITRNVSSLCCSSVILLRPRMGVAPHKHDVRSMQTHTKHISIERYHPVVSIMLRYLDQIKTFGENLCCRKVKIDKLFGGDLPFFAFKCDNFPKAL